LVRSRERATEAEVSPQEFSSEPSLQSLLPLQKRPRSMQLPSPQASWFSWQMGSSVTSSGFTFFSRDLRSQFLTEAFQLQVCSSMSKARPAGQRMACRPCKKGHVISHVIARRRGGKKP
jgi:hypothetical protein